MIKKFNKCSYRWSTFGIIAVSSLSLLNARADGINESQKEKTLGTPENAKKDFGMSKEAFEQYIQFYKEILSIQKKAMVSKEVPENFEGDVK